MKEIYRVYKLKYESIFNLEFQAELPSLKEAEQWIRDYSNRQTYTIIKTYVK